MRTLLTALLTGAAFMSLATTSARADDITAARSFAADANTFALKLYPKLAAIDPNANLFFSPYSIDTALLMAAAGAKGNTAAEFTKTLHLSTNDPAAAAPLMRLVSPIDNQVRPYSLDIANALWIDQSFPILPSYADALKKTFNIDQGVLPQNFSADPEAARKTINTWVEDHTNKKITNLLPPRSVTPATRVILTNAIYFKAAWLEQFHEDATENQPFHTAAGKDVTAPLMHLRHSFSYAETPDAQILSLPYTTSDRGESTLSMLIILPKKPDGLPAVEKSLTPENLAAWSTAMEFKLVDLHLPKFKTTSTLELSKPLAALGLHDAFSDKADFSGITSSTAPENKLSISAVLHQAVITLDEHGTEAAAATAVVMVGSAMRREEPVDFRADHPFLYAIRHDPTGTLLFLGRLTDPSQN